MLRHSLALLALTCGLATAQDLSADARKLAEGNNAFACDLYKRLAGEKGNKFLSPYSISTALGMTWAGARGNTATEMANVLRFPLGQDTLHAAFGELQRGVASEAGDAGGMSGAMQGRRGQQQGRPARGDRRQGGNGQGGDDEQEAPKQIGVQLQVANALWAEKSYKFLPAYMDLVTKSYAAGVQNLDFKGNPEAAKKTINDWVAQRTQNMIKDLLKELDGTTRLVLTNAIYFKGKWGNPFEPAATLKDQAFQGSSKKVALMHRKDEMLYGEGDGFQVVQLPYGDLDRASLLVILPAAGGLAALEQKLDPAFLGKVTGSLGEREVDLFLPRFELESEFQLGKTLEAMGMPEAFSGSADLSGMDGTKNLYISQVVHKAKVILNEEGTEAAAATAVVVAEKAMALPKPVAVFRADRPFLFLIRDHKTGSILFMGRLTEPQS